MVTSRSPMRRAGTPRCTMPAPRLVWSGLEGRSKRGRAISTASQELTSIMLMTGLTPSRSRFQCPTPDSENRSAKVPPGSLSDPSASITRGRNSG